jgi:hypothetical protein
LAKKGSLNREKFRKRKVTNSVPLKKIFSSAALRKQATHFVGTRACSSYTPLPPSSHPSINGVTVKYIRDNTVKKVICNHREMKRRSSHERLS